jgi:DNA-binding NarL/FixJ family response regulator
MIKVAIIDDHSVVINGLLAMLTNAPDLSVVLTTTKSEVLLAALKEQEIDVLLLDIQMPGINGVDLCKMVLKDYPAIRVIAFSSFDDTHYIRQMMRNGAAGYLLKNADSSVILSAIETVMNGQEYIDQTMQRLLVHESITGQRRSIYEIPLTKREKEILTLIAEECTSQEIADKLFISLRTVETHRCNLNQKLGAKTPVTLVKEAIKRGLIEG